MDATVRRRTVAQFCYGAIAVLDGGALAVQFAFVVMGSGGTLAGTANGLVFMLSFFTILTNIALTVAAARLAWRFDGIFARPRVATALAVYAVVVLAIYELLLRRLWHPAGLTRVTDTIFHDLAPIATIFQWWICIAKGNLLWSDAARWLVFPALYGLWIAGLGVVFGRVPYPFVDVASLGGWRVAFNLMAVLAVFWGVGIFFVAMDRLALERLIKARRNG